MHISQYGYFSAKSPLRAISGVMMFIGYKIGSPVIYGSYLLSDRLADLVGGGDIR